jgi:hypothetical protein
MHRDDTSPSSDSQHAMVGGPHIPGDALVVQSNGAPTALAIPAPAPVTNQDVLRGGMDANTLMHALRRRWLLASCVGFVLAGLTFAVLWYNFPASSSATAIFRVANKQESIFSEVNNRLSPQSYEIYKKSQLAMLRGFWVLNAAVRKEGISSLSVFAGISEKPEDWLMERIEASYPQQGEYLNISLSGDEDPADLLRLVDAVATAYADEAIYKERTRRTATKDLLVRSLEVMNSKIADRWKTYLALAEEADRPQTQAGDPMTTLLVSDVQALQRQATAIEAQVISLQTQLTLTKQRLTGSSLVEFRSKSTICKIKSTRIKPRSEGRSKEMFNRSRTRCCNR